MYTAKAIVNGESLTDSAVTYYTSGDASKFVVKSAVFVNDGTTFVNININIVPYAGSSGYSNAIIKSRDVAPGETFVCSEMVNAVIDRGEFLVMSASATGKVGCRISGYEVT